MSRPPFRSWLPIVLGVALVPIFGKAAPALLESGFEAGEDGDSLAATLCALGHVHPMEGGGVGGSRSIRVDYIGSERGSQRVVRRVPLGSVLGEATLCYDVRFAPDFDFAKGGKLHGLGPVRPVTGGDRMRPDGWSARVMFKERGGVATYLYHQRKKGKYGTTTEARDFRFQPGRYHAVSLHVKVNEPADAANGFVHLYVDGRLLVRNDGLQLRAAGDAGTAIERLLFSTFHGGNSSDYAPRDQDGKITTVRAYFDNIGVFPGKRVRASAGKNNWVWIEDEKLRLGFLRFSGGALGHLSLAGSGRNLLDHYDRGRLVQQSYYGGRDGSEWGAKPWRYNPVQGGSYRGDSAKLVRLDKFGKALVGLAIPRHWASGELLEECRMEQRVELLGDGLVHLVNTFRYDGAKAHPRHDHETPAMFFDRSLHTLVSYSGDRPWTGGALVEREPGFPNEPLRMSEGWAAYIGDDGRGLGVYVPKADRATCYRFRDGGFSDCSYLAPLQNFALKPGLEFKYEAYLAVGTAAEIRAKFAEIRRRE